MTVRLSGNGLPRITFLTARLEPVEPLIKWLNGAGYLLTELHYTSVEDIHARIPDSDILLIHTSRPRSDVSFILDELRSGQFRQVPAVIVLTVATRSAISTSPGESTTSSARPTIPTRWICG